MHISEDPDLPQRREGVLTMITVRSNDQFNTTVYGYEDRLRGIYGTREVVLMHEADMQRFGIGDGEIVDIVGDAGDGIERSVYGFRAIRYDVPNGSCVGSTIRMQSPDPALAPRNAEPCAGRKINSSANPQTSDTLDYRPTGHVAFQRSVTTEMAYPFFTIGHSTRTLSQFVDLLRASQIELVVDVRRFPRSRTNPQFNRKTFPDPLATVQIGYVYISALGGLRRSSRTDISLNLFWENLSFRNYADYAMTQEFHEGLTELRDLGHKHRTAIMCAEAVWWRCHRRIIADYLIRAGESVIHILGMDRLVEARLTPGATPQPDGTIVYPAGSHGARVTA